jgi:hypothetical protein
MSLFSLISPDLLNFCPSVPTSSFRAWFCPSFWGRSWDGDSIGIPQSSISLCPLSSSSALLVGSSIFISEIIQKFYLLSRLFLYQMLMLFPSLRLFLWYQVLQKTSLCIFLRLAYVLSYYIQWNRMLVHLG